ncbi:hypothetical protein [Ramlibacter sp.]|uniref:hypothetical protein n=1 Tax=Ramlibacter sp. TaxID=1917967 RepID=UPI003D0BD543
MKHSLRKTPSHLHLAYKYGEQAGGLLGRNMAITADGNTFTLEIDLEANLRARNKSSPWFVAARNLQRHHHKLKSLQCPDNLVRGRLIRAWESVPHPKLMLRLAMGEGTAYLFEVQPHSLFTGGIQLDVLSCVEEEEDENPAPWLHPPAPEHPNHA